MFLAIVLSLLAGSWLFIYFFEKRNLFNAWFTPAPLRLREFAYGFLFCAFLCVVNILTLSVVSQTSWSLSETFTWSGLANSMFSDIKSVLFEELVFRGVLLYLLIKYLGNKKAILISSVVFGMYHWLNDGVMGNILAMAMVFLVTGTMGFVFATAFAKTRSIVLAFALHLGWNMTNQTVFSNGPNGTQLLVPDHIEPLNGMYAGVAFVAYMVVVALSYWFVQSGLFEEDKKKEEKEEAVVV